MRLLISLLLLCTSVCLSQDLPPINEEFNSVGQAGDPWKLVTGQSNTGAHSGELCFNLSGTYIDDTYYSYESDTLDLSLWSQVDLLFSVSQNLRNGDNLYLLYMDGVDSLWYGWNLTGAVGTYIVNPPNTAILFSVDLDTYANGGLNGRYAHIDYIRMNDPGFPLPIELISFTAEAAQDGVIVEWSTASQVNNDYFTVDRSSDGYEWEAKTYIPGAGNSNNQLEYIWIDYKPLTGTSYYRLTQTDNDGQSETFDPVSVTIQSRNPVVVRRITLLGRDVWDGYKGIVIEIYSDNTIRKTIQ